MVTANHYPRFQLAAAHHRVECKPEQMSLAQTDPADARRQSLESDALCRHVEPTMQVGIVGDQLLDLGVGLCDVLRIAA